MPVGRTRPRDYFRSPYKGFGILPSLDGICCREGVACATDHVDWTQHLGPWVLPRTRPPRPLSGMKVIKKTSVLFKQKTEKIRSTPLKSVEVRSTPHQRAYRAHTTRPQLRDNIGTASAHVRVRFGTTSPYTRKQTKKQPKICRTCIEVVSKGSRTGLEDLP